MNIKLLTEQHLEFLSLKGGCTGSSESIHVKMPYCWKSHIVAHMVNLPLYKLYIANPDALYQYFQECMFKKE